MSSTAAFSATRRRIVPRQDDGRGTDVDAGAERGQIGHQVEVVGHERVVVEVVLGRPEAVESQVGGEARQANLLVPHPRVGAIVPAVAGEDHHHPDIHGALLRTRPAQTAHVLAVGRGMPKTLGYGLRLVKDPAA
jgi:hypothetical protein